MSGTSARGSITVTLEGSNVSGKLPLIPGSIGPQVADIRKLYDQLGVFTYDPGYGNTASCESKITYIDGDQGILLHRGYPIEQLAEKSSFLEVAYLLLNGELPNAKQKTEFELGVLRHTMVHEQLRSFYNGFRRDAHPMAVICGVVGALSAFYHDSLDINNPDVRRISAFRLIAKLPTIAAWAYKYSIGQPFMYPRNDLGYAENFLYMMNAVPPEPYQHQRGAGAGDGPHPDPARRPRTERLDQHGAAGRLDRRQPVRLHRRRHRQPVGPGAWRRQRGGAEDAGRDRPCQQTSRPSLTSVKDKNSNVRLMGFGHRVYKNYDPRAKIMEKTCHEVLDELGIKDDPLLDLAMELEKHRAHDEYFISKKLYPNVDFYSGIILQADGHSHQHVHRAVRRGAHRWLDQPVEGNDGGSLSQRIGRPRQVYTGHVSATTCRWPIAADPPARRLRRPAGESLPGFFCAHGRLLAFRSRQMRPARRRFPSESDREAVSPRRAGGVRRLWTILSTGC